MLRIHEIRCHWGCGVQVYGVRKSSVYQGI